MGLSLGNKAQVTRDEKKDDLLYGLVLEPIHPRPLVGIVEIDPVQHPGVPHAVPPQHAKREALAKALLAARFQEGHGENGCWK